MKNFVERVNIELMIFGIVAISLFIAVNCGLHLSHNTHLQFEFADIYCSMAACLLIFGGASLLSLLARISAAFKEYQKQIHTFHQVLAEDREDTNTFSSFSFVLTGHLSALEFYMAAADFLGSRNVNHKFDFGLYLRECYCDTLTTLINIEWQSWVVLNVMCVVILVCVGIVGESSPGEFSVTLIFIIFSWFIFVLSMILYHHLSGKLRTFRQHLTVTKQDLATVIEGWRHEAAEEKARVGESTDSDRWKEENDISFILRLYHAMDTKRAGLRNSSDPNEYTDSVKKEVDIDIEKSEWYFQVLNLVNTSNAAIFLMHVLHNIQIMEDKTPVLYEILCVLPVLGVALLVAPIVMEITLAKAFVNPDPDIIDRVIMQQQSAVQDLLFVQQQILAMAENPKKKAYFIKISKENQFMNTAAELQTFLARLQINVAKNRLVRMMYLLDTNQDGAVSTQEFFHYAGFAKLKEGIEISQEQFRDFRQSVVRTSFRNSMQPSSNSGKLEQILLRASGESNLKNAVEGMVTELEVILENSQKEAEAAEAHFGGGIQGLAPDSQGPQSV